MYEKQMRKVTFYFEFAVGTHSGCLLFSAICFLYSGSVFFKGVKTAPTDERDIKHFGNSRFLFS